MTSPQDRSNGSTSILHVISGLNLGGAEMMLYKLLATSRNTNDASEHIVVSLSASGPLADRLKALGISVYQLGLSKNPFSVLRGLLQLRQIFDAHEIQVVQGWMYHGSLIAALFCLFKRRVTLFWNIRHSLHSLKDEKRLTLLVIRALARLSFMTKGIIYNSSISAIQHEALGYAADKRIVLPNGFNTEVFKPNPEAKSALRTRLGLSAKTPLVGIVARYHPIKGHADFVKAATVITRVLPEVHFIFTGTNVQDKNIELEALIEAGGLSAVCHLLGETLDVATLMAGLDLLCSPSRSEGFPNVIGEAMSCGVPCVATDVGASKDVIGGLSQVVPAKDPIALAQMLLLHLEMPESEKTLLKQRCRDHIVENYGLESVFRQYMECYTNAVSDFSKP